MKFQYFKLSTFSFLLLLSYAAAGQQTVQCNGTDFKSELEVVDVQISAETIMMTLSEIDKTDPKYSEDNCMRCPDGKTLNLDVNFRREFNFPIVPTDSVFVWFSLLQENLAEYAHATTELEKYEQNRNIVEENQLENSAESIKEKGAEIAMLLQQGKITPEQAEQQILALTQPYNKKLEASSIGKVAPEEYEQQPYFAIQYYNDENLTETEAFSGYLYIKEFNEKRFLAEFQGVLIERCVEKRAASSQMEEDACKAVQSQYLPEAKVLREETGTINIDIAIQDFGNNRQ